MPFHMWYGYTRIVCSLNMVDTHKFPCIQNQLDKDGDKTVPEHTTAVVVRRGMRGMSSMGKPVNVRPASSDASSILLSNSVNGASALSPTTPQVNEFMCTCATGWTGPTCEISKFHSTPKTEGFRCFVIFNLLSIFIPTRNCHFRLCGCDGIHLRPAIIFILIVYYCDDEEHSVYKGTIYTQIIALSIAPLNVLCVHGVKTYSSFRALYANARILGCACIRERVVRLFLPLGY